MDMMAATEHSCQARPQSEYMREDSQLVGGIRRSCLLKWAWTGGSNLGEQKGFGISAFVFTN